MKPIQEVIKAFEWCISDVNGDECTGCPYDGAEDGCHQRNLDALHYLKQLQKIEDEYDELKDWWAEEHAENLPLSWDELKQMEGKPVWMEELRNSLRWYGFWDVVFDAVDYGDEKTVYTKSEMKYEMAEYGTTWKAYRKERTDVQS